MNERDAYQATGSLCHSQDMRLFIFTRLQTNTYRLILLFLNVQFVNLVACLNQVDTLAYLAA